MGDVIDVDAQGIAGSGLPGGVRQRRPPSHKATKANITRHTGSLAFQETFKELMTKKEEATAEREEQQRRDKKATTKSFVDIQERSVAADEPIAKARLLEVEANTKALEAEAKARLLDAEARTKLFDTEAMTKLLGAQAMLIDEETKIMPTDLENISDPAQRECLENRQKTIRASQA
jgi:hypothetical protein